MGLIALAAGCLCGWYGRYFLIEPEQLNALCSAEESATLCVARAALISLTFGATPYGPVASVCAVLAWMLRGRVVAVVACSGLFAGGLFLYDTGWSAAGLLGLLLRLPRIGAEPPNPREFRA